MSPRRASRWILPPAASIAVHAGLLIALTVVTVEVTRDRPQPRPARVTLAPAPAPSPNQTPNQAPDRVLDPAGTPGVGVPAAAEPRSIADALAAAARAPGAAPSPVQLAPAPVTEAILRPDNAGAPRVRFAEIDAAPARTVVFVVDASGAVASAFTFVREELLRSIDQLSPTQRFQVIVFPGPENTEPVIAPINRGRLALATPGAKREVARWMAGFRPRGQSKPLAGLRDALAMRPDIVMLITRSIERTGPVAAWGDGLESTLDELDRLNPTDRHGQRRSAIAAVQLLDPDPTGIMPAIAARHGQGVSDYRVISADTLAMGRADSPRPTGAKPSRTIDAAAAILADLDDAGTALRLFQGLPDDADRRAANEQAARAADLAARTPDDARARVLLARARSLTASPDLLEDAIGVLGHELLHDADADAWRRLALVDALTAAGRTGEAVAALNDLHADSQELPVSRPVRARMITTAAALGDEPADPDDALQRAPFVDDTGTTDPYWVLALAEARVRGRLRTGASDPFTPLLDLLGRAEAEGADAWPPILTDRITRAADIARDLAPDRIAGAPARVRLIIATAWGRSPATRARARELLASLIAPDSPHRAEALWRLALLERSLDTPASRTAAADLFARLAADHPADPNAPDALAGAIALTTDTARLRTLLARATAEFPGRPEIDLWRLRLAELLDGAARLDALEPVTPATRESTLARATYAATAESLWPGTTGDQPRRDLALRVASWLDRHESPDAARWLTRAADLVVDDDPARAIGLATRSIALAGARGQATTDAELALARAQIAADQPAEAASTLTALATRLDRAEPGAHSPAFWEAWTLLLETAGPADPSAARSHLARLELLDPDLGGEPWKTRITRLGKQLRPAPPIAP